MYRHRGGSISRPATVGLTTLGGCRMRQRSWLAVAVIVPLVASALAGAGAAAQASSAAPGARAGTTGTGIGGGTTGLAAGHLFCKRLGHHFQASAGAQMFCFGSQLKVGSNAQRAAGQAVSGAPGNVSAASFAEDHSPALVHGYGQSETSIAAAGPYVVEAWNDSTSFFTLCGARDSKEEATGLGFSPNAGRTFTHLGGLPNPGCTKNLYGGDPSVVAYRVGGRTFFYVASLFNSITGSGVS